MFSPTAQNGSHRTAIRRGIPHAAGAKRRGEFANRERSTEGVHSFVKHFVRFYCRLIK